MDSESEFLSEFAFWNLCFLLYGIFLSDPILADMFLKERQEKKYMKPNDNLMIIGTVEQINAVLKCINPNFPEQNLQSLEKNDCYYTMNGVGVEVIIKK